MALLFNSTKKAIEQILHKFFQNIEEEYVFLNVLYCTSQHYIYTKTREIDYKKDYILVLFMDIDTSFYKVITNRIQQHTYRVSMT